MSENARTSGPSDEEIRAAARIAGDHRVSEPPAGGDLPPASAASGRFEDRPSMDFWSVLYERRTTRRFDKQRPVPREIVLELLDAALIAPTSCNLQMWDFIVVDDPEQREQLGRLSLQVLSTPVAIFVTYGKEFSEEGHANVQSAAAAMMQMSNAAHVLGMGTFWINQLGPRDQVGRILGVPPDREVIAGLALGWPDPYPTKVPRRRPFEHVVHWNHYGGTAIPTSPCPDDWALEQIRDYQQARVLNGNRYNKSRPWEMSAALRAAERLAPRNDDGVPGDDAPRWLDVLPVHGLFTGAMARHHRDHRWAVLDLTTDVAAFAAKRCPAQVQAEAFAYEPLSDTPGAIEGLPEPGFAAITCRYRLESLPAAERPLLLATLHDLLAPGGKLLLQYTSKRSFHGIADWMHVRRGGPGGVEYVLAPDPNLGPYEALAPGEVERLVTQAGFRVSETINEDVVPGAEEVEFRTRNMGGAKAGVLHTAIAVGRLLAAVPGMARMFARERTLILERGR